MEVPKEEDEDVDENLEENLKCILCCERKINSVIIDCGHSKLCITCSRKILFEFNRACPVCRKEIKKGIIKIY
jgi:hypothetical protein